MSELAAWLERLAARQPAGGGFELGLERIARVVAQLDLQPRAPVVTVAGTNGKGSTCAYLEAMLDSAGYRTGCFYSPHLHDFTERVQIGRSAPAQADLVAAFAAIEAADARRGADDKPLSYFEFTTAAAVWLFNESACDAIVLEVGLGGRLDAVNAFDCSAAAIVSVGLDHVEHLGPDRESIGREKAGIMRPGVPVVIGDPQPPASVLEHAEKLGAPVLARGRDFELRIANEAWQYNGPSLRSALPHPQMAGRHQYGNAACALAVLDTLADRLPVNQAQARMGLLTATLPARFEVLPGPVPVVMDLAHNPPAAKVLADALLDMGYFASTHAVFAALRRKDVAGMVAALARRIDCWHVAVLEDDRDAAATAAALIRAAGGEARQYDDVAAAAAAATAAAAGLERARLVVFGSFLTIEQYQLWRAQTGGAAEKQAVAL